jgi:hypothetical protein
LTTVGYKILVNAYLENPKIQYENVPFPLPGMKVVGLVTIKPKNHPSFKRTSTPLQPTAPLYGADSNTTPTQEPIKTLESFHVIDIENNSRNNIQYT